MTEYQRKFSLKRAEEIYRDKLTTDMPLNPTYDTQFRHSPARTQSALTRKEKVDLIYANKVKLRKKSEGLQSSYGWELWDFSSFEKEKKKKYDDAIKIYKDAVKKLRIKYNNVRDSIMLSPDAKELIKLLEEFAKS